MAQNMYRGLNQSVLNKYMDLETHGYVMVQYVWIDGSGQHLRCKTKTLDFEPTVPAHVPIWNFDGSSTGQAAGENSDTYLHPIRLFKDPFRRGKNKIALCETYRHDHKPCPSNRRKSCNQIMEQAKVNLLRYLISCL